MHRVADLGIARRAAAAACFGLAILTSVPALATYLGAFDATTLSSDPTQLREAHQIHPRDAPIGIKLALSLENHGRAAEAEQVLLQAAAFNRQYLPAWALTNFYFRRQNPSQFWRWANLAVERCYDDMRPLLRMALSMEPDPALVTKRLGGSARLLRSLIDVLVGDQRLEEAGQMGQMLALRKDPADLPRLLDLEHRVKSQAPHRHAPGY